MPDIEGDKTKQPPECKEDTRYALGRYLKSVRLGLNLSLRDVEEATGKEVSNAYLSQLETGKISKPSPHILYALSTALGVAYETLMERAGYIVPSGERAEGAFMKNQRAEIMDLIAEAVLAEREAINRINWFAFGSDQMSEAELRRSMIKIEEVSAAAIRARTAP